MARDYNARLLQMRAYAKTPAGIASKKLSQARWLAKRKDCAAPPKNELIAQPLLNAVALWR